MTKDRYFEPRKSSTTVDARSQLLAAASRIAEHLCDSARWSTSDSCCAWLDRKVVVLSDGSIILGEEYTGDGLYSGSAGVALFLCEFFSLTRDERARETAMGALRSSLRRSLSAPMQTQFGFWQGSIGIAYALSRAAVCLDDPLLGQESEKIIHELSPLNIAAQGPALDIISGSAGGILALTAMSGAESRPEYIALALRLGLDICSRADWSDNFCNWAMTDAVLGATAAGGTSTSEPLPLLGFSHGTSGIAAALLRLYALTHEAEFLMTARGAFAYDNAHFSEQEGNWPDFRKPRTQDRGEVAPTFMHAWCHGAPGIALSRIAAALHDPDLAEEHKSYARIAIRTTQRSLSEFVNLEKFDTTLCHGILGLCEILNIASEYGYGAGLRSLGLSLTHDLVERYGDDQTSWPLHAPLRGGPNSSLMQGISGIGHALLRAAFPERVPAILLTSAAH